MMKHLRFFFLSMLVMLTGTAFADDLTVVFDPAVTFGANTQASGEDTMEKDGITFTTTAGGLHCAEYRFAKSSVTTITSTVGNITKIVFTCTASDDAKYGPGCFAAQDGYSFEGTTGTWIGNAAEVTFTAETAQVRASKIVVTVGNGSGEEPGPGDEPQPGDETLSGAGTLESPYTVADAIIVAGKLASKEKSAEKYYIKGKISTVKYTFDADHGTATFNMIDEGVEGQNFQAYGVYYLENKPWVEGYKNVAEGDEVIVYGTLTNYNGTLETSSKEAYIYSLNGQTEAEQVEEPGPGDEPQPGDETLSGAGTLESPYTVADAIIVAGKLASKEKSAEKYYIKGKVSTVKYTFDADHGTATFNMIDEGVEGQNFQAYGVYYLENKPWVEGYKNVAEGDEVIVYGTLTNYNGTLETSSKEAYIYSLNGQTEAEQVEEPGPVEPYEFVGDGTQQNPYTVADMLHMDVPADSNPVEGQEMVWVKGIIMGSLNSSGSALSDAEHIAASNIALAETADEADAKSMLPVQLPAGDLRAALNVLDNPANVGKEVMVCGYMLKYMGRTGLKNVADFILDGEQFSDGIATIAADTTGAPVYNLAGQRVVKAQKGLYIQNGKKFVVK